MTIIQSLKSLSGYPIPSIVIEDIVDSEGLHINDVINAETRNSNAFKRCQAKVFTFLSEAPNVSQGGISFSFSEVERLRLKTKAGDILSAIGDKSANELKVTFGYKGENL